MDLSWLWFWRRRAKPALGLLRVCLLTRRGCHLCDTAWEQLQHAQQQWGFQLETVDVDSDAELVRLHGEWVPVVTVNGKVRFRGTINPVLLTRVLEAESASS